jgi:AcrR family transcriptional regulator
VEIALAGIRDAWRERAVAVHRDRIVRAMAAIVCEHGYARASVAAVCARAAVARRAFYRVFEGREDCFLAILDDGHAQACALVSQAFERSADWLEGLRVALAELLLFFEAEPQIARVCMVESLAVGGWALERRERHVSSLTQLVLDYWQRVAPGEPYPFASVGTMAAVLAIVQREPLSGRSEPLICMLGPLIRVIVTPYLDGRVVTAEVLEAERLAASLLAARAERDVLEAEPAVSSALPPLLADARAHRARQVILQVAADPGASNRQIARAIGIASDTQVSTLLARLAAARLVVKERRSAGGPNAWRLTEHGESTVLAMRRRLDGCSLH